MVAADQPPVPDKKDLHDCVLSVHSHGNDILVLHITVGNFLLLGNLLHAVQKLPIFDGLFKLHGVRGRLHLLFQLLQKRAVVSIQKFQGLSHIFRILLFGNIALAGGRALLNMIIQAGPLFSHVFRQIPAAGTNLVKLVNQLNRILHRARAGIRPVIFRLVLLQLPGKKHPGIILIYRHLDIRIRLVIHKHGIILGPVLLDQIALQNQSLQLRIRDDIFKPGNVGHHLINLYALAAAGLKILAHPVFQGNGLAYINNGVFFIVHQIDAGPGRELFQFFFYVKHICQSFLFFENTPDTSVFSRMIIYYFGPEIHMKKKAFSLQIHISPFSPLTVSPRTGIIEREWRADSLKGLIFCPERQF